MTTNILGTTYAIEYRDYDRDPFFKQMGVCGYCDKHMKLIVVGNMETFESYKGSPDDVFKDCEKEILRHEVIHAYFNESGLQDCADSHQCWANNDEMVDWFAIQGPKIMQTWFELDCVGFRPADSSIELRIDASSEDIEALKKDIYGTIEPITTYNFRGIVDEKQSKE